MFITQDEKKKFHRSQPSDTEKLIFLSGDYMPYKWRNYLKYPHYQRIRLAYDEIGIKFREICIFARATLLMLHRFLELAYQLRVMFDEKLEAHDKIDYSLLGKINYSIFMPDGLLRKIFPLPFISRLVHIFFADDLNEVNRELLERAEDAYKFLQRGKISYYKFIEVVNPSLLSCFDLDDSERLKRVSNCGIVCEFMKVMRLVGFIIMAPGLIIARSDRGTELNVPHFFMPYFDKTGESSEKLKINDTLYLNRDESYVPTYDQREALVGYKIGHRFLYCPKRSEINNIVNCQDAFELRDDRDQRWTAELEARKKERKARYEEQMGGKFASWEEEMGKRDTKEKENADARKLYVDFAKKFTHLFQKMKSDVYVHCTATALQKMKEDYKDHLYLSRCYSVSNVYTFVLPISYPKVGHIQIALTDNITSIDCAKRLLDDRFAGTNPIDQIVVSISYDKKLYAEVNARSFKNVFSVKVRYFSDGMFKGKAITIRSRDHTFGTKIYFVKLGNV
uniref:Inner core protein n=1 Tax=Kammavanpettai virus TaxID=2282480 RepID=A0A3G1RP75_9REOV|nr:inner core protein [Kammavanpettai virus]